MPSRKCTEGGPLAKQGRLQLYVKGLDETEVGQVENNFDLPSYNFTFA